MDLSERLIDHALGLGASYACVMYYEVKSSVITAENATLKSYTTGKTSGLGVRVIVDGALGIASSTSIRPVMLRERVEYAIKMARAAKGKALPIHFSEEKTVKATSRTPLLETFDSVSDKNKIAMVLDANKSAMMEGVRNSTTYLAWLNEHRRFMSSEGSDVTSEVSMTGMAQSCVSSLQGNLESFSDSKSKCAGFEFISKADWCNFTRGVAETSLKAVRARTPKAGVYKVVADPDLMGLILHEAFGHATEADLVVTGESVLEGYLGREVASSLITIIDDGMVEGGYLFPYDDEGIAKSRQIVVEKGILKGFLHSRETAYKMGVSSTGNARAQNFNNKPIVRQTNFFMEPRDESFDELVEDIDDGFYICGRGSRGGEVDVALGTFTFRAGPSYIIRRGEVGEMVRGVSISGMVLETLRSVKAIGEDLEIKTSVFGGCGKDDQIARVGHGGPHVRIEKVAVGGGA